MMYDPRHLNNIGRRQYSELEICRFVCMPAQEEVSDTRVHTHCAIIMMTASIGKKKRDQVIQRVNSNVRLLRAGSESDLLARGAAHFLSRGDAVLAIGGRDGTTTRTINSTSTSFYAQYSAEDGAITDWIRTRLSSFASQFVVYDGSIAGWIGRRCCAFHHMLVCSTPRCTHARIHMRHRYSRLGCCSIGGSHRGGSRARKKSLNEVRRRGRRGGGCPSGRLRGRLIQRKRRDEASPSMV